MLMWIVFILAREMNKAILVLVEKNMIVCKCHVMKAIKDNLNSE